MLNDIFNGDLQDKSTRDSTCKLCLQSAKLWITLWSPVYKRGFLVDKMPFSRRGQQLKRRPPKQSPHNHRNRPHSECERAILNSPVEPNPHHKIH